MVTKPPIPDTEFSVSITHPDGVPMRFSENLATFLTHRPDKTTPFLLGEWLASLDDETLNHLQQFSALATRDFAGAGPSVGDLLMLVICAVTAETGRNSVSLSPDKTLEYIGVLSVTASFEKLTRAGLLKYRRYSSIDPEAPLSVLLPEDVHARSADILQWMKSKAH